MKILLASVQNFASYRSLRFDFQNQGLCLIEGPTGSGKSTLCDIIPWVLFGKTAKGGTVDEVISWPGDEVTQGIVTVEFEDGSRGSVHRIRGKAKDNDLIYSTNITPEVRGKDLQDTQRLINAILGMNYELYLSAAYLHEFSQTAQFFTTTAKNRRLMCEQLVDLTFAKNLQNKLLEELNVKGGSLVEINSKSNTTRSNIELMKRMQSHENIKEEAWQKDQEATKVSVMAKYERFESGRKRVVSKKCPSCNTVLVKPTEVIDNSPNPYSEQLITLETMANPHTGTVKDYSTDIQAKIKEQSELQDKYNALSVQMSELEALKQVINDFRSVSIENTIKQIEHQTNQLFTEHFDSECKVNFTIEEADKLDLTIYINDNKCSFTQLSKGQRCLLKLCFGVSVMKTVSYSHGIHFSQIFFDEALDGLSEEFKLKALGLLEKLSLDHESVFVVEHSSEFKAAINNTYHVELVNGSSEVAKT